MSAVCADAAAAVANLDGTPVRRRLGTSTDDAAIFFEDTVDRATAQCIDASPSALALLTPQRLPPGQAAHVDVTEYDASHLGSLAHGMRRSVGEKNENAHSGSTGKRLSSSGGRPSGARSALHDVTNTSSVKLNFSTASSGSNSKSPTPTPARLSSSHAAQSHRSSSHHNSHHHHSTHTHGGSHNSSLARSPSAMAAEPMVPLADFEALQKERNRFEKMYEHQRALYEEMAEKQAETYQTLQDKIIEVVALSTRNEESKRFIRQLKREFSESRTRVMDMQNKALEEAKAERHTKSRYEALIQEQERKYDRLVERHETKLAGMESLVKDLTSLRGDQDQLHVSQLDSLLKAAYAKSTALFSDLLRQGRQIDLLYDAKGELESQLEELRRERREAEAAMREERRRMMSETERLIEQIEEQQQSILNLRQMLIRTMDNRDNVFAYSRGPRRESRRGVAEGDFEDDGHASDRSRSRSSFSSSPSSIAEEGEGDRSFNEDEDVYDERNAEEEEEEEETREEESEGDGSGASAQSQQQHHLPIRSVRDLAENKCREQTTAITPLRRDTRRRKTPFSVDDTAYEEVDEEEEAARAAADRTNPLSGAVKSAVLTTTASRMSRGGQSRPIISATACSAASASTSVSINASTASPNAASAASTSLASNAVVVARRSTATAAAAVIAASKAAAKSTEAPPPLPLSSRQSSSGINNVNSSSTGESGSRSAGSGNSSDKGSGSASAVLPTAVRQEQPYRIQRALEDGSHTTPHSTSQTNKVDSARGENDENYDLKVRSKTILSGSAGTSAIREARPLANAALFLHTRDRKESTHAKAERSGAEPADHDAQSGGHDEEAAEGQSAHEHSPSSSPAPASGGSRRRLDFTTALAAVTEKRRRDRVAREESAERHSSGSAEKPRSASGDAGKSSSVSSTFAKADSVKELNNSSTSNNSSNNNSSSGGRRVIVRSGAIGSIATARPSANAAGAAATGADREEEEEEEPRLFPRTGLSQRD